MPVYAFGVRRLLGLRLPLLRTLVAGVIAVLVASPIITAIIPKKPGLLPALWFVILGYAIALLAGMTFLVVAEVFVPSGSLPGPVYFARGLRKRLGRARRYSQISRILVRRGLFPYLRGGRRSEFRSPDGRARLARSLRLALEEGGVTFVKLGQVLATRRDFLRGVAADRARGGPGPRRVDLGMWRPVRSVACGLCISPGEDQRAQGQGDGCVDGEHSESAPG